MNFFDQMSPEQRQFIKAVAMDMWDPFIKAVKKLPQARIVFDLSHGAG
jgi:transposase